MKALSIIGLLGSLLLTAPAGAVDLLQTAATTWSNPSDRFTLELTLPSLPDGLQGFLVTEFPHGIEIRADKSEKASSSSRILRVTSLRLDEVGKLQRMLEKWKIPLKDANPRVFVVIDQKTANPTDIVNLLRNLHYSEHVNQISQKLGSDLRVDALQAPSSGFAKLLASESYNPTMRQLYEDYVYRQTLEHLGVEKAWTAYPWELEKLLKQFTKARIYEAMKLLPRSGLSVLAAQHSSELGARDLSMAGIVEKRAVSAVEISLHRSGADIQRVVAEASGLVSASRTYGAFDHDRLMFSLSGISPEFQSKLRTAVQANELSGQPTIVRYFNLDPEKPLPKDGYIDFPGVVPYFEGSVLGRIRADAIGTTPVVIPGNSIVLHTRTYHGTNILGKYNPGLINRYIAQALMENKWAEYLFWNQFVPGVMAETHLLKNLNFGHLSPAEVKRELDRMYPEGWILKESRESNTGLAIITNADDFGTLVSEYRRSDFDQYRAQVIRDMAGRDADEVSENLRKHPHYKGWRISQMLAHSDRSIVQRRLPIKLEFRVESIAGKILGGATADRYDYVDIAKGNFKPTPRHIKEGIERFAQSVVDRLPPTLRGTPFGFDIALLEGGNYAVIESNMGPESATLSERRQSISASNWFLKNFSRLLAEGKVYATGMSDREQMQFLEQFFRVNGIDVRAQYPVYQFQSDRLVVEFPPLRPDPAYYSQFSAGTLETNCERFWESF